MLLHLAKLACSSRLRPAWGTVAGRSMMSGLTAGCTEKYNRTLGSHTEEHHDHPPLLCPYALMVEGTICCSCARRVSE